MNTNTKRHRFEEVKKLLLDFSKIHLDNEITGYVFKLWEKLMRKRTLSIERGAKEVWAAAVVCVIARLNFLFDRDNNNYISAETVYTFFGVNKNTAGNKATMIQKECGLKMGGPGFCRKEITDMFTVVEFSNGFVLPKEFADEYFGRDIIVGVANEEESEYIEEQLCLQEIEKQKQKQKKKQNNKRPEKIDDAQLSLF
ncbi:DUF6398 domain-containing protein [Chlamydiota bacterium]